MRVACKQTKRESERESERLQECADDKYYWSFDICIFINIIVFVLRQGIKWVICTMIIDFRTPLHLLLSRMG